MKLNHEENWLLASENNSPHFFGHTLERERLEYIVTMGKGGGQAGTAQERKCSFVLRVGEASILEIIGST